MSLEHLLTGHLRSWSRSKASTPGVSTSRGTGGSTVYRLDASPTDHAADSRNNLMAELTAQRNARLNRS